MDDRTMMSEPIHWISAPLDVCLVDAYIFFAVLGMQHCMHVPQVPGRPCHDPGASPELPGGGATTPSAIQMGTHEGPPYAAIWCYLPHSASICCSVPIYAAMCLYLLPNAIYLAVWCMYCCMLRYMLYILLFDGIVWVICNTINIWLIFHNIRQHFQVFVNAC